MNAANIPDMNRNTKHAVVLDTIKDGNFIFKNTYAENKQLTIPVEEGPLEFYYLHMELTEEAIEKLKQEMNENDSDSSQSSEEDSSTDSESIQSGSMNEDQIEPEMSSQQRSKIKKVLNS